MSFSFVRLGYPVFIKNCAPGSPSNDDRQLGRLTASPFLSLLRLISFFHSRSLLFSSAFSHRQRFRNGKRLVNPDLAGKSRWFESASYGALRVTLVSNIEHILALPQDVFRLAIVNRGWRQQAYAGMTVLVVVPPKKTLTESTTVLDAPKAVRNSGHTSWFGIGSRKRDCRPRRAVDYEFW